MTTCENRRAVKKDGKFDATALAAANKTVPDCSTHAQRKQWMDAYIAAGGAWECADPTGVKRDDIVAKCPPGSLEVFVCIKKSGAPIEGAEVKVVDLGSKKTNADGLAVWESVQPKSYDITVSKARFSPGPWTGHGQVTSGSKCQIKAELKVKGQLWFSIYYIVDDNAFKKAAETWAATLTASEANCAIGLCYMTKAIRSEAHFKQAWQSVLDQAVNGDFEVVEGRLYTHASVDSTASGLEFLRDPTDPSADGDSAGETTLTQSEIAALPVLPWASSGQLWLVACNTGVERGGWSPAQEFANRQRVTTQGTPGYAYFSEQWAQYDRFDAWGDDPLYLRSYYRSDNVPKGATSTGVGMPEKAFTPQ